jgi:[ribosomal protein S5]-alanine N-acetyltransferase
MALATQIVETQFSQEPEIVTSDWRTALPVISAGTVALREPRMSDAPALFESLTTEKVARFISAPPSTLVAFERFVSFTHRERAAGRFFCFAIVPHGFNTPAGLIQVQGIEPGCGTAEWGFALASAFWGKGLFTEAAESLIEFAFETVGLTRLEARTCALNGRGNGALAKLGAVREAVLHRSFHRHGQYFDQVLWSILRQDWRQSRAAFGAAVVH